MKKKIYYGLLVLSVLTLVYLPAYLDSIGALCGRSWWYLPTVSLSIIIPLMGIMIFAVKSILNNE